jgi:hypothetical protein
LGSAAALPAPNGPANRATGKTAAKTLYWLLMARLLGEAVAESDGAGFAERLRPSAKFGRRHGWRGSIPRRQSQAVLPMLREAGIVNTSL